MEEIIRSFVAGIVGLFTIFGAWRKGLSDPFAWPRYRKEKRELRSVLDEPNGDVAWRELSMLARHIHESEDTTQKLLLAIGARRSLNGRSECFALKERRPIPRLRKADSRTG